MKTYSPAYFLKWLLSKTKISTFLSPIFIIVLLLAYAGDGFGAIAQRGSATTKTSTSSTIVINKPTGVV